MNNLLNMMQIEGNIRYLIEQRKIVKNKNRLNIICLSKDPVVESYMKGKVSACKEFEVECDVHKPNDLVELKALIKTLQDNPCNKIIVQMPIDEEVFGSLDSIMPMINSNIDVDGFDFPMRKLRQFKKFTDFLHDPCFSPTAKGVLAMMYAGRLEKGMSPFDLKGETVTVIGKGLTSGLPIVNACISLGATIYSASSATSQEDLDAMLRDSTFIVSCVGKPNIVNKSNCSVRDNVVYINVGMSKIDNKIVGDIDWMELCDLENTMYVNSPLKTTGRLTCLFCVYNTIL